MFLLSTSVPNGRDPAISIIARSTRLEHPVFPMIFPSAAEDGGLILQLGMVEKIWQINLEII